MVLLLETAGQPVSSLDYRCPVNFLSCLYGIAVLRLLDVREVVSVVLGDDQHQFRGVAPEIMCLVGLTQDIFKGLVENSLELFNEGTEFISLLFAPPTL